MAWYWWGLIGVGAIAGIIGLAIVTSPIWVWFFWKGNEQ